MEFKWYKNEVSAEARQIREEVFQKEQGVLPEEEFDGSDRHSESLVMSEDGKPIATGRIVIGQRGEAMIGRLACIKEKRGTGCGKTVMERLIERCMEKGFDTVYVHAQTRAKGFYKRLGFEEYGEVFMEAGIPHINMKKVIAGNGIY